jgi:hypothetical protein
MQNRRNVIPEASVITDFAITTVNVPDRLDVQEVRAREVAEAGLSDSAARGSGSRRRWGMGLVAAGAVLLAAFGVFHLLSPAWSDASAEGIAARLSRSLGQPVRVSSAGVRLAPTPRLVVEGIDFGGDLKIDRVALRFNWSSLAKYVRGAGWVWGEMSVGPLELSPDGAFRLMRSASQLSTAVPAPIDAIRFESIRLRGVNLLPARYQALAERNEGGSFSDLKIVELDSNGQMELGLSLASPDQVKFRLRAFHWRPPFGPGYVWHEVSAEGTFGPQALQIDTWSANGFLGVVSGTLAATKSADWSVRGTVHSTNVDLAAIQREVQARAKAGTEGAFVPAVQGILEASGALSGRGATLADALDRVSAVGRAQVRFAALNRINLGAGALRGDVDGTGQVGTTRFTDLQAAVVVSRGAVRLSEIVGTAGALRVTGTIGVERNLAIGGILRASVTSNGGPAPADFRVSGTLLDPQFEP